MTVKPKYYYNLDGNISDGEKEYSLHHKYDKEEGLTFNKGVIGRYIVYGTNSLLDLLNDLNEENDYLKKSRREFDIKKVQKLTNENEGLRQTIKAVYELLTIQIDVFTDEAVKNDNTAYRELLELDNKDAQIIASATKQAIKLLKMELK